jgi:hypothetical protein
MIDHLVDVMEVAPGNTTEQHDVSACSVDRAESAAAPSRAAADHAHATRSEARHGASATRG